MKSLRSIGSEQRKKCYNLRASKKFGVFVNLLKDNKNEKDTSRNTGTP